MYLNRANGRIFYINLKHLNFLWEPHVTSVGTNHRTFELIMAAHKTEIHITSRPPRMVSSASATQIRCRRPWLENNASKARPPFLMSGRCELKLNSMASLGWYFICMPGFLLSGNVLDDRSGCWSPMMSTSRAEYFWTLAFCSKR